MGTKNRQLRIGISGSYGGMSLGTRQSWRAY